MEVWKTINGFPNYEISSFGNVRNSKGLILKPKKNKGGYLEVCLCENGKRKSFLVHRLVAIHFIDNSNNYNEVNHKDENKTNNHVSNLEWCSPKYNSNYGTRTKRMIQTHNERQTKRSEKPVLVYLKDGSLVGEFKSLSECERQINYSIGMISMCLNGKTNSRKYNFEYKNGNSTN